jgi:hypothetical protein
VGKLLSAGEGRKGEKKEKEIMGKTARVTDCEWEFIGEGYNPAEAVELCADEEGRGSEEETRKVDKDKTWEYWYG